MAKFLEKGRDAVRATAAADAKLAVMEGQVVYCPKIGKASGLAAGIDTWALTIEGIESEGWTLEHWAIDPAGAGRPIFRRAS